MKEIVLDTETEALLASARNNCTLFKIDDITMQELLLDLLLQHQLLLLMPN